MKNTDPKVTWITHGAAIAALYVVLTLVFAPISFGPVQVRIAEALCILPMFTPAAIPGLFIGCLIANGIGGGILLDGEEPPRLFGRQARVDEDGRNRRVGRDIHFADHVPAFDDDAAGIPLFDEFLRRPFCSRVLDLDDTPPVVPCAVADTCVFGHMHPRMHVGEEEYRLHVMQ